MSRADKLGLTIALIVVVIAITTLIATQPPILEVELQDCIDSCLEYCEHGSVELGGCLESCVETYNLAVTATATTSD